MLRAKYNKRVSGLQLYRREIVLILLVALTTFLALALASYTPYDASWFYYTSHKGAVSNVCGPLGAQCAALLFYLCGSASFLLVGMLTFIIYMRFHDRSLAHEWDRLVACIITIGIVATLSNSYRVDSGASSYPGGYVGHVGCALLHSWLDDVGMLLFLYTLLLICTIVIIRFSCMGIVIYCMRGVRSVQWRKKVWIPCVKVGTRSMRVIINLSYMRQVYCAVRGWLASQPKPNTGAWLEYELQVIDDHAHDNFWAALAHNKEKNDGAHTANTVPQAPVKQVVKEAPLTVSSTVNNAQLEDEHTQNADMSTPHYQLPNVSLFISSRDEQHDAHLVQELELRAQLLQEKLERFGVSGRVVAIKRGPVVTLFEYKPEIDSKISKIVALEDDLALALQALSIRIIAPIPGRAVVGFEVANSKRKSVALADVIKSPLYSDYPGLLPLILGKNTIGADVIVDLASMPHLLVAGSTGSGKSVALNAMLVSLLCKRTPQELRLILIDPKRLEFAAYADIAHLLFPIVTNPKQATPILQWVVKEMEERYTIMAARGARNLADYNSMVSTQETKPLIVVVIDELADLMMTAGRDIESLIARITQMARAAGIHMMVATQRPSVDVITGLIKVNFPSRISFRVTSKIDSRTILDCGGADKLLGKGDMLFLDAADAQLKRVHGAYVSDKEILALMNHIRAQGSAQYLDLAQELPLARSDMHEVDDILYDEVVKFLQEIDEVSISLLQRKFRIGYNRSARIIELLQARGLVLSSDGGKTRKVVR